MANLSASKPGTMSTPISSKLDAVNVGLPEQVHDVPGLNAESTADNDPSVQDDDERDKYCSFCLVAEFDIDKGATLTQQYPGPIPYDPHQLAELMLPDGIHQRHEDWTLFFLPSSEDVERTAAYAEAMRKDSLSPPPSPPPLPSPAPSTSPPASSGSRGPAKWADGASATGNDKHRRRDSWSGVTLDEDWTDQPLLPPLDPAFAEGVTYTLTLVRTKRDSSTRRGAQVKAMCIGTRLPFLHAFKPLLLVALDRYFSQPGIEHCERVYNAINNLDLSAMPVFTRTERTLLRAQDRRDLFDERFARLSAEMAKRKVKKSTTHSSAFSSLASGSETAMTPEPQEEQAQKTACPQQEDPTVLCRPTVDALVEGAPYPEQDDSVPLPTTEEEEEELVHSLTHPLSPSTAGRHANRLAGRKKDTRFFDTMAYLHHLPIPIHIPLTTFPQEVGDYSLIALFTTFGWPPPVARARPGEGDASSFGSGFYYGLGVGGSGSSGYDAGGSATSNGVAAAHRIPVQGPVHPHLHTNGALTHPLVVLFNAIHTNKRVLFLGYGFAAHDVAGHVLAALALASGCGVVLDGLVGKTFPYINLNHLDLLVHAPEGYVAGVTNPRFEELGHWDVLCNLETRMVSVSKHIQPSVGQMIKSHAGLARPVSGSGKKKSSNNSSSTFSSAPLATAGALPIVTTHPSGGGSAPPSAFPSPPPPVPTLPWQQSSYNTHASTVSQSSRSARLSRADSTSGTSLKSNSLGNSSRPASSRFNHAPPVPSPAPTSSGKGSGPVTSAVNEFGLSVATQGSNPQSQAPYSLHVPTYPYSAPVTQPSNNPTSQPMARGHIHSSSQSTAHTIPPPLPLPRPGLGGRTANTTYPHPITSSSAIASLITSSGKEGRHGVWTEVRPECPDTVFMDSITLAIHAHCGEDFVRQRVVEYAHRWTQKVARHECYFFGGTRLPGLQTRIYAHGVPGNGLFPPRSLFWDSGAENSNRPTSGGNLGSGGGGSGGSGILSSASLGSSSHSSGYGYPQGNAHGYGHVFAPSLGSVSGGASKKQNKDIREKRELQREREIKERERDPERVAALALMGPIDLQDTLSCAVSLESWRLTRGYERFVQQHALRWGTSMLGGIDVPYQVARLRWTPPWGPVAPVGKAYPSFGFSSGGSANLSPGAADNYGFSGYGGGFDTGPGGLSLTGVNQPRTPSSVLPGVLSGEHEAIMTHLAGWVQSPSQVVELLSQLPSYGGGLATLAWGALSPSSVVRNATAELFTQLLLHPTGCKLVQGLDMFTRLVLEDVLNQVAQAGQVDESAAFGAGPLPPQGQEEYAGARQDPSSRPSGTCEPDLSSTYEVQPSRTPSQEDHGSPPTAGWQSRSSASVRSGCGPLALGAAPDGITLSSVDRSGHGERDSDGDGDGDGDCDGDGDGVEGEAADEGGKAEGEEEGKRQKQGQEGKPEETMLPPMPFLAPSDVSSPPTGAGSLTSSTANAPADTRELSEQDSLEVKDSGEDGAATLTPVPATAFGESSMTSAGLEVGVAPFNSPPGDAPLASKHLAGSAPSPAQHSSSGPPVASSTSSHPAASIFSNSSTKKKSRPSLTARMGSLTHRSGSSSAAVADGDGASAAPQSLARVRPGVSPNAGRESEGGALSRNVGQASSTSLASTSTSGPSSGSGSISSAAREKITLYGSASVQPSSSDGSTPAEKDKSSGPWRSIMAGRRFFDPRQH